VAAILLARVLLPRLLAGDSIVTQGLRGRFEAGYLDPMKVVLFPLVGPRPAVGTSATSAISYNASTWMNYGWLAGLACVAIALVLLVGLGHSWWRRGQARLALALCAWVAFNFAFHSVWGDQFFLFAPHWLGALWLLVLLPVARLPVRALVALTALVVAGQLASLASIAAAIASAAAKGVT
jgi:hypothetical protein